MKRLVLPLRSQFLALVVLAYFAAACAAVAAVGFTVSPAAITNDYKGKVMLTITGLSVGQTVKVERLFDFNGNNTVDAEDFVIRTATVTDGQLPLIGGVRNLNEPGDEDGLTNGTIVVKFNVPGLDSVFGNSAGSYVFRVSDPNSGFAPLTQPFTVAQKSYPQAVTGRLTAAVGGQALTNILMALLSQQQDSGPLTTTSTDANGNYSLLAPPGGYAIVPIARGYYIDQSANGVAITAGQTNTLNLALPAGQFIVTGSVTNSTSNKGVPGIFVQAESTNNLFAAAVTDTNGNYSFSLPQNQWKIHPDEGQLAQHGLVTFKTKLMTNITASVSGLNFAYTRATALIYGTIKDNLNQPVLGLSVGGGDQGGVYDISGASTETNGGYSVGVFAGTWQVGPESDLLLALGYAPGTGTNVTLTTGQAVAADFVLRGVTAHLRGQIKDDAGAAITNFMIVVQPVPVQPGGAGSVYPTTDANGFYDAGVYAGTWNIALEAVAAQSSGYVNISGINYVVADNVDQTNNLVFPKATATITGSVRNSLNQPIAGVTVDSNQPINGNSSYLADNVITDSNGNYQLRTLGGSWTVSVRSSDLNSRGYSGVNNQTATISGGTATANFVALPVPTAMSLPTPLAANQFRFTVTTPAPVVYGYSFQYSTNARPGTWVTLLTTNPSTGSFQFTDATATNAARFYRVTSP